MITTFPSELQQGLDELRSLHFHIPHLIRAAEMLLPEQDGFEELRSVLAAAHRFSLQASAVAQTIENEVPDELKSVTLSFQMKE
ncbi:hypothetical protein [Noviherbaspirillum sp. ST9]|uniref:hypothetical protein n=1 Tax=Noviherbaspirillum sp. ST9 TaxID=3401606 RepID=UPI003B5870BD